MYKYWKIKDMKICISLLLLTLNVPHRIDKCTPDWEPLLYIVERELACFASDTTHFID